MLSTLSKSVLGATLLAACLGPGAARAAITVYDQILGTTPAAVANPNVDSFTNCLAAEGCMGNSGLVDTVGGNLPNTLTFTFSLSAAQVAAVNAGPGTLGMLT